MSSTWDTKDTKDVPIDEDEVLIIDTEDGRNQKRATVDSLQSKVSNEIIEYSDSSTQKQAATRNGTLFNISTAIEKTSETLDSLTSVKGLYVREDGLLFFVIDSDGDSLTPYTIDEPWDISSGITGGTPKALSGASSDPRGVYFALSGLDYYVTEHDQSDITQYTIDTEWDLSSSTTTKTGTFSQDELTNGHLLTASVDKDNWIGTLSVSISSGTSTTNATGTLNIVDIAGTQVIISVTIDTPGAGFVDDQALTMTGASDSVSGESTSTGTDGSAWQDIVLSPLGDRLYLAGGNTGTVYQFDLTTKGDISAHTFNGVFHTSAAGVVGIEFSPDGYYMYVSHNDGSVTQLQMTTAWDLSTITDTGETFTLDDDVESLRLNPDGTNLLHTNSSEILEFDLGIKTDGKVISKESETQNIKVTQSVEFFDGSTQTQAATPTDFMGDIETLVFKQSIDPDSLNLRSGSFKSDGTALIAQITTDLFSFTLSTPWDISSLSSASSAFNTGTNPLSVFVREDGTKAFFTNSQFVKVITLPNPWTFTDAVVESAQFDHSAQGITFAEGLHFSPDGTKMFILNKTSSSEIFQYDLSIPFDLDTVVFNSVSFSLTGAKDYENVVFNSTGKRFYVANNTDKTIEQYDLTTPWDLSDVGTLFAVDISDDTSNVSGFWWRPDFAGLFVFTDSVDLILQYDAGLKTPTLNVSDYIDLKLVSDAPPDPEDNDTARLYIIDSSKKGTSNELFIKIKQLNVTTEIQLT